MIQRLDTTTSQNSIANFFEQKHVIESLQQNTDKLGNFTNSTGFNIAFGIFNGDLTPMSNFKQYFRLKVRNTAQVSKMEAGDFTPKAFEKHP